MALSVGDAEFTEKAERRMRDVVAKSGILVLASHSMDLIQKECNRVVHMEHGRIVDAYALTPNAEGTGYTGLKQ